MDRNRINLTVRPEELERLRALASAAGVSVSTYVAALLRRHLREAR